MKANKKVLAIVAIVALVAILGVCLVACNASDYQKRLEKKGYIVTVLEGERLESMSKDLGYEVEFVITAGNLSTGDEVKFKKSADAKKAYNDAKENVSSKNDIYRSGKIVISGTKQGVKDAK